ncbi:crossover junction endodeoxyribonuclease RuvC [Microbacterium halophytorum]|uniref:crossover junction endodeoxyribonuclease RuvC n=1 Tax=Microbacterium halophytorum TaxID=2067568 RepID=UPI001E61E19D|nr:crossover junction endodeoxyribonuclease RuvC [Microbacterium halophytorum]
MASTRVIGIDPGLTRCGVGVVDVAPDRTATLVHVGVVRSAVDAPVAERLRAIGAGIRSALETYDPAVLAVERVFAQHNLQTVMGTAQASGVALMLAAEHGIPAAMHTPSEVKAAITGYGNADKAQVQHMVARVLRLDEPPKPADAADAVAIALCHAWRGGGGPGTGMGGAASADGATTPAQRAWVEAEKRARRAGARR